MSGTDPIATFRRRAYRHTLEGGVAELFAGLYTLTVGVATQRVALLALAVAYLSVYALNWRFVHERLTSRRTGYAEIGGRPQLVLLTGILASAVLTLLVVAGLTLWGGRLWDLGHWPTWAPVLAGLILAGGFLHTFQRSGLWRWAAYAGCALAGSIFFWLFPFGALINPSDRLTLFFFAMSGVLLLAGTTLMIRFTRTRPVVAPEVGDGR